MTKVNITFEADTDDAIRSIEGLADSLNEPKEAAERLNETNAETGLSLTDLNSGFDLVSKAAGYLQSAYSAVITPTLELAASQRELALAGQISAEEAGTLIQVGDDLGIGVGTLSAAFRELAKDGIQPTIANLGSIAEKYQSIQDPTERLQFAQKALGRSYQDMLPFLSKTKTELAEMAEEASATGLVMSTEAVEAAKEYELAIDGLSDKMQGLVARVGQEVIPVLTAATDTFIMIVDWNKNIQSALADHSAELQLNTMTYQEYNAELLRAAESQGYAINAEGDLVDIQSMRGRVTETLIQANYLLTESERATAQATAETKAQTAFLGDERAEAILLMQQEKIAQEQLNGTSELSKTVYQEAEAALRAHNIGLSSRLELEQALALASGEITQADIARKDNIDFLTQQLALGKITQEEYLAGIAEMSTQGESFIGRTDAMAEAIAATGDTIENEFLNQAAKMDKAVGVTLPESLSKGGQAELEFEKVLLEQMKPGGVIESTIIGYSKITGELIAMANALRQYNGLPGAGVAGGASGGASVPGFASGGSFIVPPGFPNDSFLMGVQSGEKVSVTPAGQTTAGNSGATINVYASDDLDVEIIARKVANYLAA